MEKNGRFDECEIGDWKLEINESNIFFMQNQNKINLLLWSICGT